MNKTAVLTICMNSETGNYTGFSTWTRKSQEAYANKIGADYIVITERKVAKTTPHYEKFQLHELLNQYERIIYFDTDLIVRKDCPNLFEMVQSHTLGVFNEGQYKDRSEQMYRVCKEYGEEIRDWNKKYYNTGVMVVSRCHKELFKPPVQEIHNYYEQSYLNLQIIVQKIQVQELDYKFNRMKYLDDVTGEHRLCSYIVHYAGVLNNLDKIIPNDLARWDRDEHLLMKRNITIGSGANVGDVVESEVIIRYVIEEYAPDANVTIVTEYPRVFEHLKDKATIYKFGKEPPPHPDVPTYVINAMVEQTHPITNYLNASYMHVLDYMSLLTMHRQIPDAYKQIQLVTDAAGDEEVRDVSEIIPDVIVHPGKGWPSKTFPEKYWLEIITELSKCMTVGVIGRNLGDKNKSVCSFELPDDIIDYRDLLSLGGLFSLIKAAPILISNDSAPVHIAGAFDNEIIVLPTCKHPDFILPYRNGSRYYKAKAFHKKILNHKFNPIEKWPSISELDGDIMDYLVDPKDIIDYAIELDAGIRH